MAVNVFILIIKYAKGFVQMNWVYYSYITGGT